MNKKILFGLVILAIALGTFSHVFARGFGGFGGFRGGGFGGFRGGGFGGGGFRAGGFEAGGFEGGGFHAGGFDAGGFHAEGAEGGGYRAGGFDAGGFGGYHAGGWGGSVNRGELGSFLHLPTDGGMSAAGGARYSRGAVAGPEDAAAWRGGTTGHIYQGPMGTTVAHGTAGVQGVAAGPEGVAGGTRVASGTAIKGPEGNVYAQGATASRGFAASSSGVVAGGSVAAGRGYATAGGARYSSHTYYHAQAVSAQHWCEAGRYFTPDWCAAHPLAWCPAGYTAAAWATAAWRAATWPAVSYLAATSTPMYYDYGTNITYQGDNVYYGSQPVGTAQQYYQEADSLANQGANVPADQDSKWLPLGTFGLMAAGQKIPDMVFQLSVNSAGIIRGNYYDQVSESTLAVHGSIDKRIQRAAWQIGNNKDLVIETGLYNFTESRSTALVHFGPSRTEQFLMVQLRQPAAKTQSQRQ